MCLPLVHTVSSCPCLRLLLPASAKRVTFLCDSVHHRGLLILPFGRHCVSFSLFAYLTGTEPEGPPPARMLNENSQHALHRAANRAVDNDRALCLLLCVQIGECKLARQEKIELNGRGLVLAA